MTSIIVATGQIVPVDTIVYLYMATVKLCSSAFVCDPCSSSIILCDLCSDTMLIHEFDCDCGAMRHLTYVCWKCEELPVVNCEICGIKKKCPV
jgi:hypothetical protein